MLWGGGPSHSSAQTSCLGTPGISLINPSLGTGRAEEERGQFLALSPWALLRVNRRLFWVAHCVLGHAAGGEFRGWAAGPSEVRVMSAKRSSRAVIALGLLLGHVCSASASVAAAS